MNSNQSTFANTPAGRRQSISPAAQMEHFLYDAEKQRRLYLAKHGCAEPAMDLSSGSSLYTHGVASSPSATAGKDTNGGGTCFLPSELNTIPETQGEATVVSALSTGTTCTAGTQVASADASQNDASVSVKVKRTFGQKLRDLLSPKGLALFNKEMPAAPGFGCKNAHPETKKLRRSETKHAEHFQATKKWSKWLRKIRLSKIHNACYVQRIPVCGQSECPVEGRKVHRLSVSRAVCKVRVFASRAGFKSVDTELVNSIRPSNVGTRKSVRLDSELLAAERELSDFRAMRSGDFNERMSTFQSNNVDNSTFISTGPLTWMKNKNVVQEAGTGAQAPAGSVTPANTTSLFDSGLFYSDREAPTLPFVKPAVEKTPLSVAVPERPVIAANFISSESTLRTSLAGHGDKVIEEIEKVIGQINQGFPNISSLKESSNSGRSVVNGGHRPSKYGQATIDRKLGDMIAVALRPGADFKSKKCTEKAVVSTKSVGSDVGTVTGPKAGNATAKDPANEKSLPFAVETIKSLRIVKKSVPALPVETKAELYSWLSQPKSQLWAALRMDILLVHQLDGKFQLRCLTLDMKLLCKSKTENALDEYLESLKVEVCVEVQQETVRFESSATLTSGAMPNEVAPTLGTKQVAHLQGLIRGQDDLMRLYKKKFLAQFDIHDRIQAFILALMENLQATGEVFVKICTDLANSDDNMADYESRLTKLKDDFDAMSQTEQSAVESISKIDAGFTTGLIEVIRQHAEACNVKELYQQQFHNVWVHTLGRKALSQSEADSIIGCLNVDSQRGFLDTCVDLEAYSVLSQKFDRIKAVYKEVSRARADFMKVYTELASRLSAQINKSYGGKATPK